MTFASGPRVAIISIVASATLAALIAGAAVAPRGTPGGTLERGSHAGREYRVFVPAGLDGPAPMGVGLHGCAQTAEDFATGTRLNAAAAHRRLIVVYPIQTRRDNPSRC